MAPAALDLKVKERLAARAHLCTFHCTMYNALYTIHCIKHTLYKERVVVQIQMQPS